MQSLGSRRSAHLSFRRRATHPHALRLKINANCRGARKVLLDTLAPPDSIVSRPRVHFAKMTVSRWCKLYLRRREMQLWALAPGCVSIFVMSLAWKFIRCAIVPIFAHEHQAAATAPAIEIVLNYCDLGPKWSHLPKLAKLIYCGTWEKKINIIHDRREIE